MEIKTILEQVDFVSIDVFCPEGWRVLNFGDIKLAPGEELPPPEVMRLGAKRIYSPQDIAEFHRVRNEMQKKCLAVGTRFLGGYLVPRAKTDALFEQLQESIAAYDRYAKDFLATRTDKIEAWASKFPAFKARILAAVEPESTLKKRLQATVACVRINAVPNNEAGLQQQVAQVGNQVLHEIAVIAAERVETAFNYRNKEGKPRCTRKVVNVLTDLRDKLDGLAFIDSNLRHLVNHIDQLVSGMSKNGPYEGQDFYNLYSMMLILSDERKAMQLAQGLIPATGAVPGGVQDNADGQGNVATESDSSETVDEAATASFYFPDDDEDDGDGKSAGAESVKAA